MRERTTFVHRPDYSFDPKQLKLEGNSLHIQSLEAARQDRLTLSLYELPQEIWKTLKQCHELHIRWISSKSYKDTPPFISILSPGLHILFTPQKDRQADLLCPLLSKVFGEDIACTSPAEAFIRTPVLSERFASTAAYQYYRGLLELQDLITYIKEKACTGDPICNHRTESLAYADYFDFDYDAISQSVTLTAFWHCSPGSESWNERIDNQRKSDKIEIGVLANRKATQPQEISLDGFLAVIGEDSKPSPTLFSFPSRHHLATSNFSANFVQPTGLHPTLSVRLPSYLQPPSAECALHAYLTIPSFLFVDQYQLASANYLTSKNLHAIRALSGETDLEAPDWAISKWGSALLLELAPPSSARGSEAGSQWHAEIPLHLRYLQPSEPPESLDNLRPGNQGGHRKLSFPWPNVFWACPTDEGTKMNTNPFDRVNLGYDGLFSPRTMFYHLQPTNHGKPLVEQLQAPTMDMSSVQWVEIGTVISVSLGFMWVLWKLRNVIRNTPGFETENRQKDD